MPLVRFAVRNEYGLGVQELYKDAVEAEDPKAVLEGVTVAGLVGILRQLGDLAEFAAEIFHGLQEQVASTASRSRKLGTRVQRIEASLPQLEKAILSQTSHIHFAYTPGTEWHPRIRNEQNHFIYDDLPHFIMDSYEESREPPRLQLLDRFDAGGPGSCLKRYSDPTFFKRASAGSEVANGEKPQYEKKARKSKRRRSSRRSGSFPNYTPTFSSRTHLSSTGQKQSSLSHTGSAPDVSFRSGKGDQSNSLCSKDGEGYIECVFHSTTSISANDAETTDSSTGQEGKILHTKEATYRDDQTAISGTRSPVLETSITHSSSSTTWDEKLEMLQSVDVSSRTDDIQDVPKTKTIFKLYERDSKPINAETMNQLDDLSEFGSTPRSFVSEHGPKATTADMQDVSNENFDLDEEVVRPINAKNVHEADDLSEGGSVPEASAHKHDPEAIIDRELMELSGLHRMTDEVDEDRQSNFEPHGHNLEPANMVSLTQVPQSSEGEKPLRSMANGELLNGPIDSKSDRGEVQYVLDTNSDDAMVDMGAINTEPVSQVDAFPEGENTVTIIEWPQFDDIDSETDNFVDALNTMESESESDYEGQRRKVLDPFSASRDEREAAILSEQKAEMISDQESEEEHPASNNYNQDMTDDLQNSQALVPSTGIVSLEDAQPSCKSATEGWKLDDSAVNDPQSSVTSLPSGTMLSLEHAQSSCTELAVVQDQKLDDSICSFDDESIQSDKPSPAYIEYLEHARLSFNDSTAEGQDLDGSASKFDDQQHSTRSQSSANIVSLENTKPSRSELAVVQGQELVNSACLPVDEPSLEQTQLSFNESAVEGQRLDDSEGSFDNSHSSAASSSLATVVSQGPAQSSSVQLAVAKDHKLDDSTCILDEQSMASNKSSSAEFESLEHADSSCNESATEIQELNRQERIDDNTQPSTGALPLATLICREIARRRSSESTKVPAQKLDDSMRLFDEQLPECPKSSSASNVSEAIDVTNRKSAACEIAPSSSQAPPSEEPRQTSPLPQEMPVGFSSTTPLAFWTNGNLLGLAPSKPTVLSASSSAESAPVNSGNGITAGQFNPSIVQKKANGAAGTHSDSTKEAKIKIADQNFESPTYKSDQMSADKYHRSLRQDQVNRTDPSLTQGLTNGHIIPDEPKAPNSAGMKHVSAEVADKAEDGSSLLSFLGRGLLKNGLRRTGSLGYDEKPKTINPLNNKFETAEHASFSPAAPETNVKGESNSPMNSPPPSPPLEHMKISFRPIDGFESSKLKLKYPEGVDRHESTIDIFPSFQLVPEPSNLKHDLGSDSDDDTFCRSYAGMSDDFLNHLSDSNSEEWESEDSSESSSNHAVYDSFHRISSTQSASSSPHCEEATHGSTQAGGSRSADAMTLEPSPLFDLPVLDTKNPFSFQEMKLSLHKEINSSGFQEEMPQTPPLPPVQWRVSRAVSDATDINQYPKSDLVKVSSATVPSRREDVATMTSEKCKLDDQKLDRQQQNSIAENGRKTDEKGGDFLHQIRAKSFNLRRTEITRSASIPGAASSNNVTAILQKANAIRKAVASDDGEDDSWSDT